jgi:hypothetical protein
MICYRSCLIIRGDLQDESSIASIYAFMLASRSFRVAIILVIYFDLEIKSFNMINTFINTKRDLLVTRVIYQLPNRLID